ncbi:FAT domain-containing protein, partial [Pelagophyceae sp. CCMP2097]
LGGARALVRVARAALARARGAQRCYAQAHDDAVAAQQLTELDEVLDLRAAAARLGRAALPARDRADRERALRGALRATWARRLHWWAPPDAAVWHRLLLVRSLAGAAAADGAADGAADDASRRLAAVCYDAGQLTRCGNVLRRLAGTPGPGVRLRECRLLWARGDHGGAYDRLAVLSHELLAACDAAAPPAGDAGRDDELAVASLTLRAEWCAALSGDAGKLRGERARVRGMLRRLVAVAPHEPRAWHAWALASNELFERMDRVLRAARAAGSGAGGAAAASAAAVEGRFDYAVESIQGFFRCLQQLDVRGGPADGALVMQDTLRLLTVWFRAGTNARVRAEVAAGLARTPVDVWLGVLPQLIARLDHPKAAIRVLLADLLVRVGRAHPQALVCPITVSAKAAAPARRHSALYVLKGMQHVPLASAPGGAGAARAVYSADVAALVGEADLVARELHRAAVDWHEVWYNAIEHAANVYFGDGDAAAAAAGLEEAHAAWSADLAAVAAGGARGAGRGTVRPLAEGAHDGAAADTLRLAAFQHAFGGDIEAAGAHLARHARGGAAAELHQAWALYSRVHRRVKRQLFAEDAAVLQLAHVAPALRAARHLRLAVPGTYQPQGRRRAAAAPDALAAAGAAPWRGAAPVGRAAAGGDVVRILRFAPVVRVIR